MKLSILLAAALALPAAPAAIGLADAHACGGYRTLDPSEPIRTAARRFVRSSRLAADDASYVVTAEDHVAGTATVEVRWTRQEGGRAVTHARTLQLGRYLAWGDLSWTIRDAGRTTAVPTSARVAAR